MATILNLVDAGVLDRIDPQLEENEGEHRFIFVTTRCGDRINNELPSWVSNWKIEESPSQQLDAFIEVFCSGGTLTFSDMFKPLNHLGDGVWELKTADLRIFGWFSDLNIFIATNIFLADKVKKHGLYAGFAGEAVRERDKLDHNEPKYLKGEKPEDVVTGYSFP